MPTLPRGTKAKRLWRKFFCIVPDNNALPGTSDTWEQTEKENSRK
jgi:hypothetical protein